MDTLNITQAADMLRVHPNTAFKLIESGALPAARIGRAYVLLHRDVLAYVEQQIVTQTAQRMGGQPIRRGRSPQLGRKI